MYFLIYLDESDMFCNFLPFLVFFMDSKNLFKILEFIIFYIFDMDYLNKILKIRIRYWLKNNLNIIYILLEIKNIIIIRYYLFQFWIFEVCVSKILDIYINILLL